MKPTFKCATCRQVLPTNKQGGTGYGVDSGGRKHCYQCCAKRDARRMQKTGRATLYLVRREIAPAVGTSGALHAYFAANWPGTLEHRIGGAVRHSRNNFGAQRTDVWFSAYGATWHGINLGDSEILRCKRVAA